MLRVIRGVLDPIPPFVVPERGRSSRPQRRTRPQGTEVPIARQTGPGIALAWPPVEGKVELDHGDLLVVVNRWRGAKTTKLPLKEGYFINYKYSSSQSDAKSVLTSFPAPFGSETIHRSRPLAAPRTSASGSFRPPINAGTATSGAPDPKCPRSRAAEIRSARSRDRSVRALSRTTTLSRSRLSQMMRTHDHTTTDDDDHQRQRSQLASSGAPCLSRSRALVVGHVLAGLLAIRVFPCRCVREANDSRQTKVRRSRCTGRYLNRRSGVRNGN